MFGEGQGNGEHVMLQTESTQAPEAPDEQPSDQARHGPAAGGQSGQGADSALAHLRDLESKRVLDRPDGRPSGN
jgi:hypothetical protein